MEDWDTHKFLTDSPILFWFTSLSRRTEHIIHCEEFESLAIGLHT